MISLFRNCSLFREHSVLVTSSHHYFKPLSTLVHFNSNSKANQKDKRIQLIFYPRICLRKLISDQTFTSLLLWRFVRVTWTACIRNWVDSSAEQQKTLYWKCLKLDLLMNFIICWIFQTSNYRIRNINYFNTPPKVGRDRHRRLQCFAFHVPTHIFN